MIYVELFDGQTVPTTGVRLSVKQGELGTCDFTIETHYFPTTYAQLLFSDFKLYYNGVVIFSGIIESVAPSPATLTCKGYDELGRLAIQRAKSDAHYQHQELLFIIDDLLTFDGSWKIGNVSTMIDNTVRTTTDQRSKESLFSQIKETIGLCPNTFFRYGGIDPLDGKHLLDIGEFNDRGAFTLTPENVTSASTEITLERPIKFIEAYGGKSGDTRVSLQEALNHMPSLASDPEYPIVTNRGKLCVENLGLTAGLSLTKEYSSSKTENATVPSTAQKNQAGFSAYQAAVADMEKAASSTEHKVTVLSERPINLNIGQRLYTNIIILGEKRLNRIGTLEQSLDFSLQGDLRVIGYEVDVQDVLVYNLDLREGNYAGVSDVSEEVYTSLDKHDSSDSGGALLPVGISRVSVTHGPGVAADDTIAGPVNAKSFVFALPTGATTSVSAIVSLQPGNYRYEIKINPELPATALTIAVAPPASAWSVLSECTATVIWFFA